MGENRGINIKGTGEGEKLRDSCHLQVFRINFFIILLFIFLLDLDSSLQLCIESKKSCYDL